MQTKFISEKKGRQTVINYICAEDVFFIKLVITCLITIQKDIIVLELTFKNDNWLELNIIIDNTHGYLSDETSRNQRNFAFR